MYQKSKTGASEAPVDPAADSAPYEEHMDEMRCILYSHGGTYDFPHFHLLVLTLR